MGRMREREREREVGSRERGTERYGTESEKERTLV
jgi:hypothetical protein